MKTGVTFLNASFLQNSAVLYAGAKPCKVRTLKRKIFEHLKLSELVKYLGTIRKSELKKTYPRGTYNDRGSELETSGLLVFLYKYMIEKSP